MSKSDLSFFRFHNYFMDIIRPAKLDLCFFCGYFFLVVNSTNESFKHTETSAVTRQQRFYESGALLIDEGETPLKNMSQNLAWAKIFEGLDSGFASANH